MGKKLDLRFKESEDEKEMHQADDEAPKKDAPKADHADEDQDKELFAKMIKQYLGKEEPDEMECEMAKQAYQTHKEKGMEHEAAMEAAGKHLQMAAEIGKKMHQAMQSKEEKHEASEDESKEGEKHEGEKKEDESEAEDEGECKEKQASPDQLKPGKKEKKKEADVVAKLSGEVAKLRESVKVYELKDYLESKLRKSGQSNACTKLFREALGKPRSIQHIDETWNTFIKAFKAGAEEVGSSDDALFVEKNTYRSNGESKQKAHFADCLDQN